MSVHGERKRRQLYGRRKGPKLSAHQAQLFDTLLPKLALGIEAGRDPRRYFSTDVKDVWLEVGFGGGEHMLALAQAHPDVGLIGAEPYEAGVAKLLSKVETWTPARSPSAHDLPLSGGGKDETDFSSSPSKGEDDPRSGSGGGHTENIRIHMGDARDVIEALPDHLLGKVFILFPDPWPKTRHHKRRFVQMAMLNALARVLKPGGELRFASDDAGYLTWALERLCAHDRFAWNAICANDWKRRPENWPQTRYESKALHGPPAWLSFRRL